MVKILPIQYIYLQFIQYLKQAMNTKPMSTINTPLMRGVAVRTVLMTSMLPMLPNTLPNTLPNNGNCIRIDGGLTGD